MEYLNNPMYSTAGGHTGIGDMEGAQVGAQVGAPIGTFPNDQIPNSFNILTALGDQLLFLLNSGRPWAPSGCLVGA